MSGKRFLQILDTAFRYDGERIAFALDGPGYEMPYLIVILNKDGSLFSGFRETSTTSYGQINFAGMLFDSTNSIILALDYSLDGTSTFRQAVLTKFSVNSVTSWPINSSFFLRGGSTSKQS